MGVFFVDRKVFDAGPTHRFIHFFLNNSSYFECELFSAIPEYFTKYASTF
jgi:hypothetical protein